MLEYVLEMASDSQTCVTFGEQIINGCLKFLARNCGCCAPDDFKFILCLYVCVIAFMCVVFQTSPQVIIIRH